MNQEKIGQLIKQLRTQNNWSQAQLAEKLSVTSQAISKWENGRGLPDISMMSSLCELFNITMEDLLHGEKAKGSKKSHKKFFLLSGIILVLIIGATCFFLFKKGDSFEFSKLASDNDRFSIKGVVAYDKKKKSIYISDINYDEVEEQEYFGIECILYESNKNIETKISQCGDLTKNQKKKSTTLSKLLKNIEFNIDNYDCSCTANSCKNLYLKINALDSKNNIVTYNIPLQVDNKCTTKK